MLYEVITIAGIAWNGLSQARTSSTYRPSAARPSPSACSMNTFSAMVCATARISATQVATTTVGASIRSYNFV